ncbi:MAG TPA: hypothetical protein VF176_08240 [Solirubrobacterales bacterium]
MRLLTLTAIATVALSSASLALAEDVTRDSYTAAVEPICAANAKANDRILKNVRQMVKQGKLKPAGAKFIKASEALKKTLAQLKAVPQPPADTTRLAKWLKYVKKEADLFNSAGKKLQANNKIAAQRIVVQLTSNANQANNTVIAFNFHDCRFQPSKYT